MSTVEAMFHGRLFRMTGGSIPEAFPRPFGDRRMVILSAWKGGVEPRLWLVPDGWESDGLQQVYVSTEHEPPSECAPDDPGAVEGAVQGFRLMKVVS